MRFSRLQNNLKQYYSNNIESQFCLNYVLLFFNFVSLSFLEDFLLKLLLFHFISASYSARFEINVINNISLSCHFCCTSREILKHSMSSYTILRKQYNAYELKINIYIKDFESIFSLKHINFNDLLAFCIRLCFFLSLPHIFLLSLAFFPSYDQLKNIDISLQVNYFTIAVINVIMKLYFLNLPSQYMHMVCLLTAMLYNYRSTCQDSRCVDIALSHFKPIKFKYN